MVVIAEISGADSIAAALRFADEHPGRTLVPTYVATGTEFGSFDPIRANVDFLTDELARREAPAPHSLVRLGEPTLWRALNGRPARTLAGLFGAYLPCVGCHLYLRLMRVRLARELGADTVVAGEREHHGDLVKANQLPEVLDAYVDVLAHAGLALALPLRHVADGAEIAALLGERWPGGSPQLECVLSGNERGLDGTRVSELPPRFVDGYMRPVGIALVDEMTRGGSDWDAVVATVLCAVPKEAGL
jgi:hypothetical protein